MPIKFGGSSGFQIGGGREELTPLQLLELQFLLDRKNRKSLLGRIFGSVKGGTLEALEFITRPSFAVAGGALAAAEGKPFSAIMSEALKGLRAKTKHGFGEVLDELGLLEGHRTLRGIAGFGLDVATDPTLPLTVATAAAAAPATGGVSLSLIPGKFSAGIAARAATAGVSKRSLIRAAEETISGTNAAGIRLANVGRLEDNLRVLKSANTDGGFDDLTALAETRLRNLDRAITSESELFKLTGLAEAARVEIGREMGRRTFRLGYSVPFTGGKVSAQIGTPIPTLNLKTLSESTKLPAIPGLRWVPGVADLVGKAFKPGFSNEKINAWESIGRRVVEQNYDESVKLMRQFITPHVSGRGKLTDDEIFDALHIGETTVGIVGKRDVLPEVHYSGYKREINDELMDQLVSGGQLTAKQAEFLRDWNEFTEHLRHRDYDFGLKYDKPLDDVVYVPHMYSINGTNPFGDKYWRSILTKRGFEYERLATKPNSVKMLQELYKSGVYRRELETHPIRILSIRARRGSQAQGDRLVTDIAVASTGVPTGLRNTKRLAQLSDEKFKKTRELSGLKHLDPEHTQKLRAAGVRQAVQRHRESFTRAREVHRERVATLKSRERHFVREINRFEKKYSSLNKAQRTRREFLEREQDNIKSKLEAKYAEKKSARGSIRKEAIQKDIDVLVKQSQNIREELAELGQKQFARPLGLEANLKDIRAKLASENKRWNKKVKEIRKKRDSSIALNNLRIDETIEKQLARGIYLQKRLEKIDQLTLYHNTSLKNPKAYGPGMRPLPAKIRHASGSRIAVPSEVEASLKRIRAAVMDDEFSQKFGQTWLKAVGEWKVIVTALNIPGYRIRNTISDFWNMYVKGVPVWGMARYGKQASGLMTRAHRYAKKGREGTLTSAERKQLVKDFRELQEAFNLGILSGLYQGDIARVLRHIQQGPASPNLFRRLEDVAVGINRQVENWGRMTHYLYRRRWLKEDPTEAARHVREAHFDYESLTNFEKKIRNNFIPFYTWTRKNIPYQIRQITEHPGRYSSFYKMYNEMNYITESEEGGGIVPDFIKEGLGFRIGTDEFLLPQFGPSDVARLETPLEDFGLMLNPALKIPAELLTNRSFLTGAPIRGDELVHPLVPSSGLAATILGGGTTARDVDGTQVQSPGVSPLWAYLLGQIPQGREYLLDRNPIAEAKRDSTQGRVLGYLGLSSFDVDQQQQVEIEERKVSDAFRQYIRGLRDSGGFPEVEEKEPSAYQNRKRSILREQLING